MPLEMYWQSRKFPQEKNNLLLPVKCDTKQKVEDRWGFIKLEVNPTICPGLIGDWSHQFSFLKF